MPKPSGSSLLGLDLHAFLAERRKGRGDGAFEVIDGERENGEMGIHAQASYGRIRASGGC